MKVSAFLVLCALALAQGSRIQFTASGKVCNCDPGQADNVCRQSNSEDYLIVHENCNQFYKCVHGQPVTQNCYNGLLYDPIQERCEWPDTVNCGTRPIVEIAPAPVQPDEDNNDGAERPCNCNPSEAPTICSTTGSDGVLIAHENCNQFYQCNHGIPVTQNCFPGLVYDAYIQRCEWPYNVDCGGRPIVETEVGGNNGNTGEQNPNEDCGGWSCYCDPAEAPAICAIDRNNGEIVAHENCNQFYQCVHGEPVVRVCQNGLLFNVNIGRCDWPQNVNCGNRPIVEIDEDCEDDNNQGENGGSGGLEEGTCNCSPEEAPSICSAEESEGVLVAHENCNFFYKCSNGVPVAQNCPSDLLYDPRLERCEWPQNVDCGNRPVVEIETPGNPPEEDCEENNGENGEGGGSGGGSEGGGSEGGGSGGGGSGGGTCNCNPGEAPGICARDDSDGVLVAHENCNQFYKCSHGISVALSCQDGLVYDPYLERCEWPENVDCGDRPIAEIDNGGDGENGESGGSGGGSEGGGSEGGGSEGGDLEGGGSEGGGSEGGGSEGGGSGGGGSGGGGSGGGTCNCNPGEAPGICARDDSDGVLVAHENCNQFYKCSHGISVALSCQDGLVYDPYLERCEWPENVDCGDRPIAEIDNGGDGENGESGGSGGGSEGGGSEGGGSEGGGSEGGGSGGGGSGGGTCNCNPGEAPGICARDDSDGVLVAHENCNQFYKCSHGISVALSCQDGLVYDPYLERCEWPENVDCGDRPIAEIDNGGDGENGESGGSGGGSEGGGSEGDGSGGGGSGGGTCNCNPGEAAGICARGDSDGVLVAHENCNQFYKCSHGISVALSCQDGLVYDPYAERCDWPANVDCGDRTIVETDNGGNQVDNSDENNNNNVDDEECEENNDGTCNCNPSDAVNICLRSGSDGDHVAHENCNQFYKCAHGVPVVVNCPPGLFYEPRLQRCDWPYNVQCGDRPIVEIEDNNQSNENNGDNEGNGNSCNCNPAEAPTICAAENSESILVAHEKCNYFYKCTVGSPVAVRCNGNLLYNPYIRACDWPQNVDCENRIISDSSEEQDREESEEKTIDGHCDPSQAPAICAVQGSNNVLVAHENCNNFYICLGGLPVTLSCPSNLLYNPSIEQCDWPQNVDCGDRSIPETETPGGECACDSRMAPSLCADNNSNGKFVAHGKCDQFYRCVGGIPVEFSCPAGLFYEPYTQSCNWPAAVNCDGRHVSTLYSFSKHLGARRGIF